MDQDYRSFLGQMIAIGLNPSHLRAYGLMAFIVLGMFAVFPFMPTYLVKNVGCAETDLKYMYLVGGLATLAIMHLAGWIADRFSKLRLFQILAGFTMVPILLITNLPRVSLVTMLAATTLLMATTSARMVPLMALVTASAQPRQRGGFMSINASVQQMAMGLAAQLAALMIHTGDDGTLTGFSIVGGIAAATSLFSALLAGYLRPAVTAETFC